MRYFLTGRQPKVNSILLVESGTRGLLEGVIGGLREIGEPARKALIVDLAQPVLRARTVGLYYLIRSVAITPAAFIGGLLWERQPSLPFVFAMAVGLFGTLLFTLTVDEGGL